jgi:hypothetical protein
VQEQVKKMEMELKQRHEKELADFEVRRASSRLCGC